MTSDTAMVESWIAEGPVLLSFSQHVATLTLNRPDASNGMNITLMRALHVAVMRCHSDPRVRVVHLRGSGPNFCAGGDVREFASKGEQLGDFLREVTAYLQMAVGALIRLNSIVVTEVHGYAAGGGGLGLVCASDIVIAGRSAKFLAGATRVGMAPDGGAQKLVQNYARGAPRAIAAAKRLLWTGLGIGVESCLPEEARTVAELSATADAREGLAAVLEKRTPIFTGR